MYLEKRISPNIPGVTGKLLTDLTNLDPMDVVLSWVSISRQLVNISFQKSFSLFLKVFNDVEFAIQWSSNVFHYFDTLQRNECHIYDGIFSIWRLL